MSTYFEILLALVGGVEEERPPCAVLREVVGGQAGAASVNKGVTCGTGIRSGLSKAV